MDEGGDATTQRQKVNKSLSSQLQREMITNDIIRNITLFDIFIYLLVRTTDAKESTIFFFARHFSHRAGLGPDVRETKKSPNHHF